MASIRQVLALDTGGMVGLILSVPTEAKYILKMLNEELLAGSALLVQSGTLVVSHIGFINFFWFQLSNVMPAQVCSAPAGRQVISTTLAAPQRKFCL